MEHKQFLEYMTMMQWRFFPDTKHK